MRTEEEQAELLRDWWEKNGVRTILVVVIAVLSMLGWRQWQSHQDNVAADASSIYQTMIDATEQSVGASPEAGDAARNLVEAYPRSAYADHARLLLAANAAMQADYDTAVEWLNGVIERPATRPLEHTARIRLARIHLERGEHDAALAQLNRSYPEAWQGQVMELRGDVMLAGEQQADARDAYSRALELFGQDRRARDRVQMKLNDLTPAS